MNKEFRAVFVEDNKIYHFSLKDISNLGEAFINYKNWEQFTGLKDCHGRKIYEGDILSITLNGRVCKSVVEWEQPSIRNDYEESYQLALNGYVQWGRWVHRNLDKKTVNLTMYKGNFEVIGNIWDNTDLLEDQL